MLVKKEKVIVRCILYLIFYRYKIRYINTSSNTDCRSVSSNTFWININFKMFKNLFLIIFCQSVLLMKSSCNGVIMVCTCNNLATSPAPPSIKCESISFSNLRNTNLENVIDTNSDDQGWSLDETYALEIKNGAEELTYIPSNLGKYFPNLQNIFIINTKLQKISSTDLKQFPKLLDFVSIQNLITSLPANLFEGNQNLRQFGIVGPDNYDETNSLRTVGKDLLISAPKLEAVTLKNNFCVIDEEVSDRARVIDLNSRINVSCEDEVDIEPKSTSINIYWIIGAAVIISLLIILILLAIIICKTMKKKTEITTV